MRPRSHISERSLVNSESSLLRSYYYYSHFIDKKRKTWEAEAGIESWTPPARMAPTWPVLSLELQGCHNVMVLICAVQGVRALWG